jgi:hypothetical protein
MSNSAAHQSARRSNATKRQLEEGERAAAELERRLNDPTTPASALIGQTEQQVKWRLDEPSEEDLNARR